MAGTLREELASLKIDRPNSIKAARNGHSKPPPRRGGGGLRLISWILWMIPLGSWQRRACTDIASTIRCGTRAEVTIGRVAREDLGGCLDLA